MATKLIYVTQQQSIEGGHHLNLTPNLNVAPYSAIRIVAEWRSGVATINIVLNMVVLGGTVTALGDVSVGPPIFTETLQHTTKSFDVPGTELSIDVYSPQGAEGQGADVFDLYIFGNDSCCNEKT